MNKFIEAEEKAQADYWFTYKAGNFAVFLFLLVALYNDHEIVTFFGLCAQVVINLVKYPKIVSKFEKRLKAVVFKTQVENLYVFTLYEDQPDDTVSATFYRTIELLKEVGNKHEVRVHMVIFQDVQTFTWFVDRSGKLVKNNTWREKGSATETWEQYQEFVAKYEADETDKRLRELRKDGAGFDWVNENIFGQWQPEK